MLHYFKAATVFLLWSCIALISHYYISINYPNYCFSKNKTIQSSKTLDNPTKLVVSNTNNDTIFKFQDALICLKNSNQILVTNTVFLDSIASYLNTNYDEYLAIYGFYDEIENSNDVNLGIARAETLKDIAIKKGIDVSKLDSYGDLKPLVFAKNNNCYNAIKLQFQKRNVSYIDSIEKTISNKVLHIEFTNDNTIANTEIIDDYIPLLNQYLKKIPKKEITIIGHTDNIGYYQYNLVKGLAQANTIKDYLIRNGITTTKISTNSKGESEPIATKYTEEGKAKNRRIEIKIK